MTNKVVKDKVLCYVVRDGWILVFRHIDHGYEEVGIQMPAGSIRPGETPEAAALREAGEETGFTHFTIVRKLGEVAYDITPYRFEIQRRHVFAMELTEPTGSAGRIPRSRPRSWRRPARTCRSRMCCS